MNLYKYTCLTLQNRKFKLAYGTSPNSGELFSQRVHDLSSP